MTENTYKKLKIFKFADKIRTNIGKKVIKGIIFGNFGANNMGDEAILAGELAELKRIAGISVVVVSKNPREIKRIHNAQSIYLYNPVSIFMHLLRSDFAVVGGGGLICKPDRGIVGLIYQIYIVFLYFALPKLLKKKAFALGLGVYDNSNPLVLKLSAKILKSFDLVTVRDYHSYHLLKSLGVDAKIYKDNSFLMKEYKKADVQKVHFFKKHYYKSDKNIGFALIQPDNKTDEDQIFTKLVRIIQSNGIQSNYWFYISDFQKGFQNDLIFAHRTISRLTEIFGNSIKLTIVPTSLSPKSFFSSFKLMDEIVSMRLHSSIFAYRNKIDFQGITYDIKCTSFLESIGKIPVYLTTHKQKNMKRNLRLPAIKDVLFTAFIHLRRVIYISMGTLNSLIEQDSHNVFVLSYHSVNEDGWRFSIDTKEIKKQIEYLYQRFNIIDLRTLDQIVHGKKRVFSPSVVLTFDDGYKDILKLKSFFLTKKIKPAIFLLSDTKRANWNELGSKRDFLSESEIRSLYKSGFEIGSHTNTHPNLTTLSEKGLEEEIIGSRKTLEKRLKIPIRYFSYPRGKYNLLVVEKVRKAGYALAMTMDDGIISKNSDPLRIPRIGVDRSHSFAEFKYIFSKNNILIRSFIKNSYLGRYI